MIRIKGMMERNTGFKFQEGKELIIRVSPIGIWIKLSGQRWENAVLAPYDAIFTMASKISTRSETPVTKVKRGLMSVK